MQTLCRNSNRDIAEELESVLRQSAQSPHLRGHKIQRDVIRCFQAHVIGTFGHVFEEKESQPQFHVPKGG